jgi:hypothetical protein
MERVRRTLWILWGSFCASSLVFGLVAAVIPHPEGQELDLVMLVLLGAGLIAGGGALLGGRLLSQRLELMPWCILRWGLAELPAAFGLALWVLGAPPWAALGACAFGLGVNLLQAPSDASQETWAQARVRGPNSPD